MSNFTPEVYERIRVGCQRSAEAVVPLIYDLVRPRTVADIGGGEGWWGRAFYDRGCDVLVADSSGAGLEWKFEIESGPERRRIDFLPVDLTLKGWAARIAAERASIAAIHGGRSRFDLALCLEVAEHLPADAAETLVAGLCSLAPVVLFSAAIPGQGGHGHVNEQWPAYWAERFHAFNYVAGDIRPRVWDDELVEPWYRQNLLIFASLDHDWLGTAETYGLSQVPMTRKPAALVHPDIYGWRIAERDELAAKLDQLNGGTDG